MKKISVFILVACVVIFNFSCSKNSASNTTNNTTNNAYSFTAGPTVTDIDGNIYQSIVTSCGQTWTTSNYDVSHYRNGDEIPFIYAPIDPNQTSSWGITDSGACCYNTAYLVNYRQYAKLYNWYAINDLRGFAPAGWHIPTKSDWNKLIKCIDNNIDTNLIQSSDSNPNLAGGAMKEAGFAHWISPNNGGNNQSGFCGLPGGGRGGGLYSYCSAGGTNGGWWSSSLCDTSSAFGLFLSTFETTATIGKGNIHAGGSVRLVKD